MPDGSRMILRNERFHRTRFFSDIALHIIRVDPLSRLTRVVLLACGGAQGLAVVGDLMNLDDCKRAVEKTVAAFGGLDVLVNNGG